MEERICERDEFQVSSVHDIFCSPCFFATVFVTSFSLCAPCSDGDRCLEVGSTRKSGFTGGLSRAPYARVCKFGLITRPIFSNSGGYVPPRPLRGSVTGSVNLTAVFLSSLWCRLNLFKLSTPLNISWNSYYIRQLEFTNNLFLCS